MTSNSSQSATRDDDTNATPEALWELFFPYETPYKGQEDGITQTLETATSPRGGYTVLEGACGTGKTLIGLVAGLALVRSPQSPVEQVVVATSVKQQLEAFQSDLDAINSHLSGLAPRDCPAPVKAEMVEPVTATTLVGKADICPYAASGEFDRDDIYQGCHNLQENTRGVVAQENDPAVIEAAAEKLTSQARGLSSNTTPDDEVRSIQDVDTHPFPEAPVSVRGVSCCPYYATALAAQATETVPIDATGQNLTPDRLGDAALEAGACPHEVMKQTAEKAEVVIGNYSHILDKTTVNSFSNRFIGPESFVICDEAHTLVDKARETFSKSVSFTELYEAVEELEQVLEWAESAGPACDVATDALDRCGVSALDVKAFKESVDGFISAAEQSLLGQVEEPYSEVSPSRLSQSAPVQESRHVPLRDPETPEIDAVTQLENFFQINTRDPPETLLGYQIADAVRRAFTEVPQEVGAVAPQSMDAMEAVGPFLCEYFAQNNTEFYREAEIVPKDDYRLPPQARDDLPHDAGFSHPVIFHVRNCLPAGKLANVFKQFHAGICMSATLSPLWTFQAEAGLNYLEKEVSGISFGLQFPEENRVTAAVEAPRFTSSNRYAGPQASQQKQAKVQSVRDSYYEAIQTVVTTTPGNVLVAGPSYSEAESMGDRLKADSAVNKQVLQDESSTNETTRELKQSFVEGPPKVLVTGMRGTLSEGVDFAGEKLNAVAAFGVPIAYMGDPKTDAIMTAYEEELGGDNANGFKLAYQIPAVRKARQTIGRVIRSDSDVGVRVLIDERYGSGQEHTLLSDTEQAETEVLSVDGLSRCLTGFWDRRSQ